MKLVTCPECGGRAATPSGVGCSTCFGAGQIPEGGMPNKGARAFLGLIDSQGYPLCHRCKSRLENPNTIYCPSCQEMVWKEQISGYLRKKK